MKRQKQNKSSSAPHASQELTTDKAGTEIPIPVFAFEHPPKQAREAMALAVAINEHLISLFEDRLNDVDRRLWGKWKEPKSTIGTDADANRIWHTFDDFLLEQASVLGWRIFLSSAVQRRICEWYQRSPEGPVLLQRLGAELSLGAKVIRGEAQGRISDPALRHTKNLLVPELRLLLGQFKNFTGSCPGLIDFREAREWFDREVSKQAGAFPMLWLNLPGLLRFLLFIDEENRDTAIRRRIANGDVTAAELFNAWVAWTVNRSEESTRQEISRLGRI